MSCLKVRVHYGQRPGASPKTRPSQPPVTFPQAFVCLPSTSDEDRKRKEVIEQTTKTRPSQPPATLPQVFVSYAWGNISPNATQEDHQRQEVVERLCRKLEKERWNLIRDKEALDYGDQISHFMKTLGEARLVIVVLSEKYLRSPIA